MLCQLVADPDRRRQTGLTAQNVVHRHQGATRLTAALLAELVFARVTIPAAENRAA